MVNQALSSVDQHLPDIFNALIHRDINGDREAQIYLIDRRLGKPKQQTDLKIEGSESLSADIVSGILREVEARKREMLEYRSDYAIQIEGTGEQGKQEVSRQTRDDGRDDARDDGRDDERDDE